MSAVPPNTCADAAELGRILGRRLATEAIDAMREGNIHHGNLDQAVTLLTEGRREVEARLRSTGSFTDADIEIFNDVCVSFFRDEFAAARRRLIGDGSL
jgi:hypothetical protein